MNALHVGMTHLRCRKPSRICIAYSKNNYLLPMQQAAEAGDCYNHNWEEAGLNSAVAPSPWSKLTCLLFVYSCTLIQPGKSCQNFLCEYQPRLQLAAAHTANNRQTTSVLPLRSVRTEQPPSTLLRWKLSNPLAHCTATHKLAAFELPWHPASCTQCLQQSIKAATLLISLDASAGLMFPTSPHLYAQLASFSKPQGLPCRSLTTVAPNGWSQRSAVSQAVDPDAAPDS
jgi:hypothetical protein